MRGVKLSKNKYVWVVFAFVFFFFEIGDSSGVTPNKKIDMQAKEDGRVKLANNNKKSAPRQIIEKEAREANGKTTAENMGAYQEGMKNIKNKEKGEMTYDEALEQFSQGIIASEAKKMKD